MLEYLNFCLLIRIKKYFPILKLVEDIFSGPQSDTKHQKLLECVLTGNSKLYLGKAYTEDQLAKLSEEEVENFLIIMKLSSQARWCVH